VSLRSWVWAKPSHSKIYVQHIIIHITVDLQAPGTYRVSCFFLFWFFLNIRMRVDSILSNTQSYREASFPCSSTYRFNTTACNLNNNITANWSRAELRVYLTHMRVKAKRKDFLKSHAGVLKRTCTTLILPHYVSNLHTNSYCVLFK
jgi:hypothetical protein